MTTMNSYPSWMIHNGDNDHFGSHDFQTPSLGAATVQARRSHLQAMHRDGCHLLLHASSAGNEWWGVDNQKVASDYHRKGCLIMANTRVP